MEAHGSQYAYVRYNDRVEQRDAHELVELINTAIEPRHVAREQVIAKYGGPDAFRCCFGHRLILHNIHAGHFQHYVSNKASTGTNQTSERECCPCLTPDYQTHDKALHALKKLIEDPSTEVRVQQWYAGCSHEAPIFTIPSGANVRLNERMQGQPGYLSGQIVADVAIYVDGQHWMTIEVRNTHKTDPASRPGRMIEVSARHINQLYDNHSSGSVVLLPDTPSHHACVKCQAITTLHQPLMHWMWRVRERKEKERQAIATLHHSGLTGFIPGFIPGFIHTVSATGLPDMTQEEIDARRQARMQRQAAERAKKKRRTR